MPPPAEEGEGEGEEEDYMSMIIEEPPQKETFTQRRLRKQRESEARGKVPSKAERAAQEAARREEALSTSTLDPSSKGFQMMAKLGFKPGDALGKKSLADTEDGEKKGSRSEPLNLHFKEDRGGIGLGSEKKRRFREEAEEAVKKVKREEGDYRDRVREERENRRIEGQIYGAQKVAERLDTEAEEAEEGGEGEDREEEEEEEGEEPREQGNTDQREESTPTDEEQPRAKRRKVKPTSQINILYRGMVRQRDDREKSILARHALHTSLPSSFFPNHSRLPTFEDETMEKEDKEALGTKQVDPATLLEQELEEEDPELDEFNALEPVERLRRLVMYLREKYHYCFWCKFRYEDEAMEGCPGVTEEDHD